MWQCLHNIHGTKTLCCDIYTSYSPIFDKLTTNFSLSKILRNSQQRFWEGLPPACVYDPDTPPPLFFPHSSIHTTVLELLLFPVFCSHRTLSDDTSEQTLYDICNSKTCVINCLHLSFVKILLALCVLVLRTTLHILAYGGFFFCSPLKLYCTPGLSGGFIIQKKNDGVPSLFQAFCLLRLSA